MLQQGHGLVAQPVQQGGAVWRAEDVVQCVAAALAAYTMCGGQQAQVVVAEDAAGCRAQRYHAAQHCCRFGAAVDQVAQQVKRVAAGGKVEGVQQTLQGAVAALHVPNEVKCHGVYCPF